MSLKNPYKSGDMFEGASHLIFANAKQYTRCNHIIISLVTLFFMFLQPANAQVKAEDIDALNQKIEAQNQEIQNLKNHLSSETSNLREKVNDYAPTTLVLFLFGGFCALWAQNTNRNPWFWFFFGMFLSVLAVIGLLISNANDRRLS
jgi:hypothetical protein